MIESNSHSFLCFIFSENMLVQKAGRKDEIYVLRLYSRLLFSSVFFHVDIVHCYFFSFSCLLISSLFSNAVFVCLYVNYFMFYVLVQPLMALTL